MSTESVMVASTLHSIPHPRMPHLRVGFVTGPGTRAVRVRVFTECDDAPEPDSAPAPARWLESLVG